MTLFLKNNKTLNRFLVILLALLLVFSSFGPIVSRAEEPADKVLVNSGSTWKYLDNGSDQGTAWKEVDFDDSAWKEGAAPLGYPAGEDHGTFPEIQTVIRYGDDSQNKHATTYFRTTFTVENLSEIHTSGLITAGIDDSAIIYLKE